MEGFCQFPLPLLLDARAAGDFLRSWDLLLLCWLWHLHRGVLASCGSSNSGCPLQVGLVLLSVRLGAVDARHVAWLQAQDSHLGRWGKFLGLDVLPAGVIAVRGEFLGCRPSRLRTSWSAHLHSGPRVLHLG